jgi:glutamyl-tRNA reductase
VIVVVGLSHQNAPIEIRERIALERARLPEFLTKLVSSEPVGEAMVISTCNRVELVAAGRSAQSDLDAVAACCLRALEQEAPGISAHVLRRTGGDAVRHLFRVASSLDSLVLGEPQILGQVKDAFDLARSAGTVRSILHRSVPRALRTAKRVRHETAIGSGQVSVPSVAVGLASQIFGELRGRTVLLVGSGDMAETVAKLLRGAGTRLLVLGRTRERVEELARAVDGEPRLWSELRASLVEADVVITSTSAPGFVIDFELVAAVRKQRRSRAQSFIDLAVPRDVDPRANEIDGVFVYNIDDFSRQVQSTLSQRSREAELASRIVEEETRGYERWADAEQATPTIVKLRALVRDALSVELNRSVRGRLKHLAHEDREALERMLEAAENRLLHGPTMRLRQAALTREEGLSFDDLASALNEVFDLDGATDSAPSSDPQASAKDDDEKKDEAAAAQATGTSGTWPFTR